MSLSETHKFSLDTHTSDLLRKRANRAGCGVSEFVRDLVCMLEHGCTYGEYVAKHRRELLQMESRLRGKELDE